MTSQEARIRELESQLAQRDEMIGTLQNSIDELNHLVTNLTEIIQQMRKDKYGPSSEKTVSQTLPVSSCPCSTKLNSKLTE